MNVKDFNTATRLSYGKIALVAALFLISVPASAQKFLEILQQSKSKNFKEIVKEADAYYEKLEKEKEKLHEKEEEEEMEEEGSEYNQYLRWKRYNQSRLTPDGRVHNASKAVLDEIYHKETLRYGGNMKVTSLNGGNWTSNNPYKRPPLAGNGYNSGQGRVDCVVEDKDTKILYAVSSTGGLWKKLPGVESWSPMTDGMANLAMKYMVIDYSSPATNRTFYILTGTHFRSSMGVIKSTDNGATWYSTALTWDVSQGIYPQKLLIHPSNHNILYVLTGKEVYKTTDGFMTFPQKIFTPTAPQLGLSDFKMHPVNPEILYLTTTDGAGAENFMRSTDGGTHFITTYTSRAIRGIGVTTLTGKEDVVYIGTFKINPNGTSTEILKSTDAGQTFSFWATGVEIEKITVSPSDENEVHAGGNMYCYKHFKTSNGNITNVMTSYWIEDEVLSGDYTHADIRFLDYIGNTIYCGSDGGVYASTNKGDDWVDISNGLEITQIYKIGTDPSNFNRFAYGTQDNGVMYSENGISKHILGGDGGECFFDPDNTSILYYTGGNNILKSSNNGTTYESLSVLPYWRDPSNHSILYVPFTDIKKTYDNGATFINISNGQIGFNIKKILVLSPVDNQKIYTASDLNIYKTTNGGTTWSNITSLLPVGNGIPVNDLIINPSNDNMLWVVLGGFQDGNKVYQTTDGGNTWTNLTGSLPNIPVNCIAYQQNVNGIYIGTDAGVYYRDDMLGDWTPFKNGLPNVIVNELEIHYGANKIRAATFGRGVWDSDLYTICAGALTLPKGTIHTGQVTFSSGETIYSQAIVRAGSNIQYKAAHYVEMAPGFDSYPKFEATITPCVSQLRLSSVDEISGYYAGTMPGVIEKEPDSPEGLTASRLSLYPNPTAGITTIQYQLSGNGPVSLIIYDVLGNVVAELIKDKVFEKGGYQVNFDGASLKNGVYFCRIREGSYSETKNLIIIK